MPDLQMCSALNHDGCVCQISSECYRHMAKPSAFQAWGSPGQFFDPGDGCCDYIAIVHGMRLAKSKMLA